MTAIARDNLDGRITELGLRLRRLTLREVRLLGEAASADARSRADMAFPPDAAFGLADYVGPKLTREERDALERLWEVVFAEIALGLSGTDPASDAREAEGQRGWRALLTGGVARDVGARATDLINKAAGREFNPWIGVCAAGNACCAVLLEERLPAAVKAALLSAWRRVFGDDDVLTPLQ